MQGAARRRSGSGSDEAEEETNSCICRSSSDVLASPEKILMFASDTPGERETNPFHTKAAAGPAFSSTNMTSTTMELTDANRVLSILAPTTTTTNSLPARIPATHWADSVEQREQPPPTMVQHSTDLFSPVKCPLAHQSPFAHKKRTGNGRRVRSIWQPRGSLTLSAFRRPENAVRLTQTDPNRHFEDEYSVNAGGVLGHGAFSTVRLAVRKRDGVKVALKSIAKHEALRSRRLRMQSDSRHYLEEWEILRRLKDNPYVIDILDVFETNEEIQLVTEYCPGGELFDAIQKKQRRSRSTSCEVQAAQITSQILQALVALHAENIVHRDVKPENSTLSEVGRYVSMIIIIYLSTFSHISSLFFLFPSPVLLAKPNDGESVHVKLCDFGVARPLSPPEDRIAPEGSTCVSGSDGEASPLTPRSRSFSTVGSDYYAAPELAFGGRYDTSVDIYSLGVTLYILLCGFPPVFSSSSAAVESDDSDCDELKICCGEVLFPESYWMRISEGAKVLLKAMLHPEPSRRISAREALQDPWIRQAASSPLKLRNSVVAEDSRQTMTSSIDLDLVRSQLYKSLGSLHSTNNLEPLSSTSSTTTRETSKLPASPDMPPKKRARLRRRQMERRASATALMALADFYSGVAAPLAAAAAAAAGTEKASAPSPVNEDSPQGSFTAPQVAALSF